MVPARYLVAIFLCGIAAAVELTRAESPATRGESVIVDAVGYQLPKDVHFVGNLSCASAACHAASDAGGRPGSEYTTWAGGDPHFRAFQVLSEPRSRRMVELLHGKRPGTATPAHKDKRCLSCHAPEAAPTQHAAAQGVGCESCHGPAEKWLTAHYQDEFKSLTRHEKAERFGLYPTKDLAFRTTLCASCHVGDAGREVNHDLIGAGHPRLAFEYTGYHHNPKYTRHWNETSYGPDFDARAWEIGQVACARSAAKLLAARAERPVHKWPELAEYGCFACHKDLGSKAWKTTGETSKPGSMPWGTWYFANMDRAPSKELVRLLEESPRDRMRIAQSANKVAGQLDIKLFELQTAADRDSLLQPYCASHLRERFTATLRHALTPDGRRFRDPDWDSVTQHYLGAAAYYYAWGAVDSGGRDREVRSPLGLIGSSLPFLKGYNSPKSVDPDRLLELFRQLQTDKAKHP